MLLCHSQLLWAFSDRSRRELSGPHVASTHGGDILCGLLMAHVTGYYHETIPNTPDFKVMLQVLSKGCRKSRDCFGRPMGVFLKDMGRIGDSRSPTPVL